jgi:hypothetical protein
MPQTAGERAAALFDTRLYCAESVAAGMAHH